MMDSSFIHNITPNDHTSLPQNATMCPGTAVWILWSDFWTTDAFPIMEGSGQLGKSSSFFTYNAETPPVNKHLAKGFLSVGPVVSDTYDAWFRQHLSNSTQDIYSGYAYEVWYHLNLHTTRIHEFHNPCPHLGGCSSYGSRTSSAHDCTTERYPPAGVS